MPTYLCLCRSESQAKQFLKANKIWLTRSIGIDHLLSYFCFVLFLFCFVLFVCSFFTICLAENCVFKLLDMPKCYKYLSLGLN